MREDHSEFLDQMFPDGYVIIYTNPDLSMRVARFNPHKDESLDMYYKEIMELGHGK